MKKGRRAAGFFDKIHAMKLKNTFFAFLLIAAVPAVAVESGANPAADVRYATDAYPGFDFEDGNAKPEKKEPRWFSFWFGPKMNDPAAQSGWAAKLETEGDVSGARKAYDALVREWPTAPEACKAQLKVAELLVTERDYEEAFKEYRYLLDFYSSSCDFAAVTEEMYKLAELMRAEGKTIVFFNFRNTVDVRRAYESLVLRAPGAAFVPKALLTIAELREEEDHLPEAVAVYENLRNLHPMSSEATEAAYRESYARMKLVRRHEYNRNRVRDTAEYLEQVLGSGRLDEAKAAEVKSWSREIRLLQEDEAWKSASFYDSRTRTKRSAVNAYTAFLAEYPDGVHAEEARARLEELKNGGELK